jgi:predicted site-specific integrase-resolvase
MPKQFFRKAQVALRYGVNTRTVDRWARDGRLPAPVHRGRIPLWDGTELDRSDRRAVVERTPQASAA